jgi:chromate reductase, NAD(P)H dehydrogenase (quinone)
MLNLKLLGICGSLRKSSFNRQALNLCKELIPDATNMEIVELSEIPLYNADLELVNFPPVIKSIKAKILQAQGILIASPEYNYSVSGVLKNTLDWISRPPSEIPLDNKAVAILSASSSRFGGARSQQHLRQILAALGAHVMPQPELYIPQAQKLFIENEPIEEKTTIRIQSFLKAFIDYIQSFR